ncbi:MAG: DNA polymerase I [Candidatus Omnitrophica bacterium]|nr:DNA polymerase I [Candidatus Omnitrophota bacterium]
MPKQRLFLIDATAFCYRAFYAIRGLSTSTGQATNAVYGFVRMLQKILKNHKPDLVGVCFDRPEETFRHKKDSDYKANRPPMPEDLVSQIEIIKEIIYAYGLALCEEPGYEADDIIATLCEQAKKKGILTTVVSSDKDLLQLVDEQVFVLNPQKEQDILYDVAKVKERFGISPQNIADLIALLGDPTDNIPSIKGITEKTAVKLLTAFGSIEQITKHVNEIVPEKLREIIQANQERILLNKELAQLNRNIKLSYTVEDLSIKTADYNELFRIFKKLEFKAMLNDLPVKSPTEVQVEHIDPDKLIKIAQQAKEMVVVANHRNVSIMPFKLNSQLSTEPVEFAFGVEQKVYTVNCRCEKLRTIIEDPQIRKIGQDLKTLKILFACYGLSLEGIYFDTMIAAYLCNPAGAGFNLADISWNYLNESVKEEDISPALAVNLIFRLKDKLEIELDKKGLTKLFESIEMPLVKVLSDMQQTGIKLDVAFLKQLSVEVEKRLAYLIEEIYGICGCQFNINSPLQLRDILFDRLKLPIVKRTKTGASTDEEVLNKLAELHPLPKKLLEYRQLVKLKSTYIDALPQMVNPHTGRIHATFDQTGTETGRLSSLNPNLQNLPIKTEVGRKIRQAVIAFSEKSVLLSCDYSQIELRILAHLSEDEVLCSAFRNNQDIHRRTACLIYGVDEKDVTDQMREQAKRINFGIIYGLSAYGLSRDLGISQQQAQAFIDAYFVTYPGVKKYIEQQIALTEKNGFVTTISGRRRYLPDITSKNTAMRQFAQRQAVNTPIQGSASDLIKMAMVEIAQEIKAKNLSARMLLQVHDELVFDVDKQILKDFAQIVRKHMEGAFKLRVPIKVEMKIGKNWLEMEPLE